MPLEINELAISTTIVQKASADLGDQSSTSDQGVIGNIEQWKMSVLRECQIMIDEAIKRQKER